VWEGGVNIREGEEGEEREIKRGGASNGGRYFSIIRR
jgi:hypothetical protein